MKHLRDLPQDEIDLIWSHWRRPTVFGFMDKIDGTSLEYRIEGGLLTAVKSRNGKWVEPLNIPDDHWNNDIRAGAAFIDELLKWIDVPMTEAPFEGRAEVVHGKGRNVTLYETHNDDQYYIYLTSTSPLKTEAAGKTIAAAIPVTTYTETDGVVKKITQDIVSIASFTKPKVLFPSGSEAVGKVIGLAPTSFVQADLNINKNRSSAGVIKSARAARTALMTNITRDILTNKAMSRFMESVTTPEGVVVLTGEGGSVPPTPMCKLIHSEWESAHKVMTRIYSTLSNPESDLDGYMNRHEIVCMADPIRGRIHQEYLYQMWKRQNGR